MTADTLTIPDDLADRLFSDQTIVVVQPIADYRHCLYQSELELVQDVSDKRMLEFSTGRDCAHQALHMMGYEVCPILRGEQREPLWPENVIGSISHCRDLAGAVVTEISSARSIGFDIENRKQLNPNIARHICTPEEKDWINLQPAVQQNLDLLLIFSLKEAVFKCVYQATGESLRFQQCHVTLEPISDDSADVAITIPDYGLTSTDIGVRYFLSNSHVYTVAYWNYLPAVG